MGAFTPFQLNTNLIMHNVNFMKYSKICGSKSKNKNELAKLKCCHLYQFIRTFHLEYGIENGNATTFDLPLNRNFFDWFYNSISKYVRYLK